MKLVCHSCGTTHALDDDRVAGTRELRCKYCEQVLEHGAAPVDSRETKAEWHVVIDGASPQFALDDLAAIATPLPTANPYAREGSGLLEIRGIADTIAPAGPRFVDDLPTGLPAGLAHSMVIVPEARSEPRSDRRIVFVLSSALAIVTVLSTLLVVLVIHEDRDPQARLAPTPPATHVSTAPQATNDESQRTIGSSAPQGESHPEIVTRPEPSTPAAPDPVAHAAPRARTTTRKTHRTATTDTPVVHVATTAEPTPMPSALATETPPPEPPPPPQECTEVDCIVSGYADACCVRFRPAATVKTPEQPAIELPESLDRATLTNGIATIDVKPCSGSSASRGVVSLSLKISPEGSVTSVTIKSAPDDVIGACVAAAAQKAVFAKTKRGGSFSYPWRF